MSLEEYYVRSGYQWFKHVPLQQQLGEGGGSKVSKVGKVSSLVSLKED